MFSYIPRAMGLIEPLEVEEMLRGCHSSSLKAYSALTRKLMMMRSAAVIHLIAALKEVEVYDGKLYRLFDLSASGMLVLLN